MLGVGQSCGPHDPVQRLGAGLADERAASATGAGGVTWLGGSFAHHLQTAARFLAPVEVAHGAVNRGLILAVNDRGEVAVVSALRVTMWLPTNRLALVPSPQLPYRSTFQVRVKLVTLFRAVWVILALLSLCLR